MNQTNLDYWKEKLDDVGAGNFITNKCIQRMNMGTEKLGEFDPTTDKRDHIEEATNELIDAINYLLMDEQKNEISHFDHLVELIDLIQNLNF